MIFQLLSLYISTRSSCYYIIFAQTSNSTMSQHKPNFYRQFLPYEEASVDNYFGENSIQMHMNMNMIVDHQQSMRLLLPPKNLHRVGYCTPPSQPSLTSLPFAQEQSSKLNFSKANQSQVKQKQQIEQYFEMVVELPNGSESAFQSQMFQYQLLKNHYNLMENVLSNPKINPLYKLNLTFQESDANQIDYQNPQNFCNKLEQVPQKQEQLPYFGQKTPNFLALDCKLEENNQPMQNLFEIPSISTKFYNTDTLVKNKQMFSKQLIQLRNTLNTIKQKIKQSNNSDIISSSTHHECRICNEVFTNGRQLGGHMSRKHPNSSKQYRVKKQVYTIKKVQRNRRMYFKKKTCSKADNQSFDNLLEEEF